MPVNTLEDLREHLQWAIELEHATLPPYLCALYSIKPGTNAAAVGVITSVFIEEMLHMTLAANLLNAVGGTPVLDRPDFIPRYPTYLPHSANAFLVSLEPFSPAAIETFMKIERPEDKDAAAEAESYETIGQFYQAIEEGLERLCAELGEAKVFTGDRGKQVLADTFTYTGSGRIIPVYDLASARAAIDEIEEQGEGLKHAEVWDGDRDMFHPEREEVAHYFRFMEISRGRSFRRGDTPESGPSGPEFDVDWSAVYPMRPNPRTQDFHGGSAIVATMSEFNIAYCELLRDLQRAFNGEPQRLGRTVPAMIQLRTLAQKLVQLPGDDGRTAGPSFEYMPPIIAMKGSNADFRITVTENGPYVVSGGVPVNRKSILKSEQHEPLTWKKDTTLESDRTYRLCRCGQSSQKPFCDNTHAKVGFVGTETAPTAPSATRARRFSGAGGITMTDDSVFCMHAGFCGNAVEKVWDMMKRSDDTRTRFALMQMVERCPSGKLGYEVDGVPVEPDLPQAISATADGPLWVTGGIEVTMSNGEKLEVRNRVTLCRCGKSKIKPLCDGSHVEAGFKDR